MIIANALIVRISGLFQPSVGASIIAYKIVPRAATDKNAPIGSSGVFLLSFEFGTKTSPNIRASKIIGTLIRNTICQS